MTAFEDIERAAAERTGGPEALAARLFTPKSGDELRAVPDDRYFSAMSLRIFRAGLKHSVVDAKWPAFEEVFHGFDPHAVRAMPDEALEALLGDQRIIRHWGKLKAVRSNAGAMVELAKAHGGMGAYLAAWPATGLVGLLDDLAKRFAQLGGNSAAYYLRMVGKDGFVLTPYVIKALNRWGAIEGEPKSRKQKQAAQAAFNRWMEQSGRPLSQISQILALSVD